MWKMEGIAQIDIIINLDPGIYKLPRNSSEGKTWLYKELKRCSRIEGLDNVIGYTYTDFRDGLDLQGLIDKMSGVKVIMFDRYDMYNGEFESIINKYSDTAIILIDCKSDLNISTDKRVKTARMNIERMRINIS